MSPSIPALGDLGYATSVACYRPTLQMHRPTEHPFGLNEQAMYLYGFWRDPSGEAYAFERKFIGPMTGGCWLMVMREGQEVALAPEALHTVRGEIKRQFSDTEHHFHGSLLGGAGGATEEGLEYRLTADTITWREGTAADFTGTLVGPGIQIATLDHEKPFLYTSQCYKMSGRAMGSDVEGFIWLDRAYWPHGHEWKEWNIYAHQEISWTVFANEFDNGEIEWGQIGFGRDGFNFVCVANADGPIVMEAACRPGVDWIEGDWAQRLAYGTSDHRAWVFELAPNGALTPFTKARWGGYRAQAGTVTADGEKRAVKSAFAWGEFFVDRVKGAGVGPVDDILAP